MLFSSVSFLFVFLPPLLVIIALSPKKLHNLELLLASIIFYAFGEPRFLPIIFAVILISYCGALLMTSFPKYRKVFLFLTITADLGFLFYFKYFNFFADIINNLTGSHFALIEILLPLGISFYTFQAISYVIDVYRQDVSAQKSLYKFALYICLFPQLIAGPIIKYHDIAESLEKRDITFENISLGIKRFIIGLAKKMLLANTLGAVADSVFSQSPNAVSAGISWLGAVAYTLQIFYDFSGYSDMAIGLGMIFGFRFKENFNYPYISNSVSEFWRRWHISLATWFKEYLYIPLGGSKNGNLKTIRNLGIVFLLTGLWHGASWNFILWGGVNGFFIILEKLLNIKEISAEYTKLWHRFLMHGYCLFVVIIGWVLFYNTNFINAFAHIKNMMFLVPAENITETYTLPYYFETKEILAFLVAILCSMPLFKNILYIQNSWAKIGINIWLLLLYALSVMEIAAGTYNPFIYFRF